MNVRATHFILYTSNQDTSADFYARVLGLAPRLRVPGMTEFDLPGGGVLGLMPVTGIRRLLGDALPDPDAAAGIPRAELYLVVDDAPKVHRRALSAGARELSPVQRRDWGDLAGYSLDPDGHVLAFAQANADDPDRAKTTTDRAALGSISPFFIVRDVPSAIRFYEEKLGFRLRFSEPIEHPFFAIVGRDTVQVFLKTVSGSIAPQPNPTRHGWAPWDAFVFVEKPDAWFAEFSSRGLEFHEGIADRDDGLRGFEVRDTDGYVLFFGRPLAP